MTTTKASSSIQTAIHERLRGFDQANLEDTLAPPRRTVILMGLIRALPLAVVSMVLIFGSARVAVSQCAASNSSIAPTPDVAVGAQYDSTHVYVTAEDFDRFVASVVVTFGGTASKGVVTTVTPTPSDAISQVISTPVGMLSVFHARSSRRDSNVREHTWNLPPGQSILKTGTRVERSDDRGGLWPILKDCIT